MMGLLQARGRPAREASVGVLCWDTNNIGEPRNRPINCRSGDSRRLCSGLAEIRVRECREGKAEKGG